LPPEPPGPGMPEGPVESLLRPETASHIVEAMAARRCAEGAPWIERIVEVLAAGHLVTRLPRRWRWTLRRGVHVEIDVGTGMIPYDADVEQLVARLRDRAGASKVTVERFRGTPLSSRSWVPPRNGEPILVVSDFGLAAPHLEATPAGMDAWLAFLAA